MKPNVTTAVPTVVPQFLRPRIGKICVAIIGTTAAEMLEKATAVVKDTTTFLEFRLDYLDNPLAALPKIKAEGMIYKNALQLLPGTYQVRFVVRDNLSGRIGSVTAPLTVN